jgi:hypothetical protein
MYIRAETSAVFSFLGGFYVYNSKTIFLKTSFSMLVYSRQMLVQII